MVLDNEIKDMLVKLLEGQKSLKTEVSDIKGELNELKGEVKKNSMKLETIEGNITIIAEVQSGYKEQSESSFKNTDALIEEKTDLIEIAVKSVSKDINEVKESIEVLKDMTGRHEVDINILKRRIV